MVVVCFKIHSGDNVATLLADAAGDTVVRGCDEQPLRLNQPVALGHKVALCDIAEGLPVIKFGVPIGCASQPIRRGDWVHLHNCRSRFDARSATLDPHSGAATDTVYE